MLQHPPELFLRRILAIERNRSGKLSRVHLFGSFANASKNGVPILRKVAQFINKINQQKLGRELPWNIHAALESDHSIAERKCPMPFLIVDNPFVIELRCPKSQLVVGIRGGAALHALTKSSCFAM